MDELIEIKTIEDPMQLGARLNKEIQPADKQQWETGTWKIGHSKLSDGQRGHLSGFYRRPHAGHRPFTEKLLWPNAPVCGYAIEEGRHPAGPHFGRYFGQIGSEKIQH